MAGRGPMPTPTATLEARGSRLAPGRVGEPRPAVKAPPCPPWLKGECRAEWRRQARFLVQHRLIAEADRAMLAAFCEAWGDFVAAARAVQGDADAPEALCRRRDAACERLIKLADRFGFSPAARARVRSGPPAEGKGDGKARFFQAVG